MATVSFGAWLAFGREKKADAVAENVSPDSKAPVEHAPAAPKTTPPAKPESTFAVNSGGEPVLYHFDAAMVQPFSLRLSTVVDPDDPGKKIAKILLQSGSGEPPAGWKAALRPHRFGDGLLRRDDRWQDGPWVSQPARPASAILVSPAFECPTGLCRLKFEYQASTRPKKFVVKFKPADGRGAWDVATPQATGEVWRLEDRIVDLKGAASGCFEYHNTDGDPSTAVRFRSVTTTELKPSGKVAIPDSDNDS